MSARRDFLRIVRKEVGPKPASVEVDVSERIPLALDRVDITYPVADKEAQAWVYEVEELYDGFLYEIWVRPT